MGLKPVKRSISLLLFKCGLFAVQTLNVMACLEHVERLGVDVESVSADGKCLLLWFRSAQIICVINTRC